MVVCTATIPCLFQVSKVVQKFYDCLIRGEEYQDDAWEAWQKGHPAEVGSAQKAAATGAGRGNCFK